MKMLVAILLSCYLSHQANGSGGESFNLYQNAQCPYEFSLPEGFVVSPQPSTQKGCGPIAIIKKGEKEKASHLFLHISDKTIDINDLPDAFELSKAEASTMSEKEIRDWLLKRSVFSECKAEEPDHFLTCPEMNIEIQTVDSQVPQFLRVTSVVADFGKLTKTKNIQYFWIQSIHKDERRLKVIRLDPEFEGKKHIYKSDVLKTTEQIGLSLRTAPLTALSDLQKKKIVELEKPGQDLSK
jgi:hypothetical protein